MKWRLSLRQTLGLAAVAAPIWAVIVFAVQGVPWALGASYVLAQFAVVCLLSLILFGILDFVARLLYGRQKASIATEVTWPQVPTNVPAMVPPADYPNLKPKPGAESPAASVDPTQAKVVSPASTVSQVPDGLENASLKVDANSGQQNRGENE